MEAVKIKEKTCLICGTVFTVKRANQRYCTPQCSVTAQKERIRIRTQRYRATTVKEKKKHEKQSIKQISREIGNIILNQYHTGKGTGSLGPEPNPDFEIELTLVENEMKRLKLKT